MSFSLQIEDSDIYLKGSAVGIVYGADKLKQDISIWLRERYRSDRFHLSYGSVLDSFIGSVIDDRTRSMVETEVLRVLQNFQQSQLQILKSSPELLSEDEMLVSVLDIKTTVNYDTVNVSIRFSTGSKRVDQLSVGIGI